MKLGFLLCSPEISGGTNVIFEHALGLLAAGCRVSIITAAPVSPTSYAWHARADRLQWRTFDDCCNESFDCLIATWWESPYLLQHLAAEHYVYFVQSIESRFFAAEDPKNIALRYHSTGADLCRNGYFFSLPVITEARWIQDYLRENFNHNPHLVRNGIAKELYAGQEILAEPIPGGLRLLIEGPVEVFHKNVPRTIELCQAAGVGEIWLLTSSALDHYPGVDRLFSRVPIAETPAIYRSCDVLVKLSYVEGMFGPPLEMFHCGGTALVYAVTGHDEYILDNHNALVLEQDDEQGVVDSLRRLHQDRNLLERLQQGAAKTAESWPSWQEASAQFYQALTEIRLHPGTSKSYLQNISALFTEFQALQLASRDFTDFAEREKSTSPGEEQNHNFLQIYLYANGQLITEKAEYYQSGSRVSLSIQIDPPPTDFQLRIDPSTRLGVILLYSLVLTGSDGTSLARYLPEAGFDQLCLTGTAKWLQQEPVVWACLSYGNDPQIFLPEMSCRGSLTIDLTFLETGYSQYFQEPEKYGTLNPTLLSPISRYSLKFINLLKKLRR